MRKFERTGSFFGNVHYRFEAPVTLDEAYDELIRACYDDLCRDGFDILAIDLCDKDGNYVYGGGGLKSRYAVIRTVKHRDFVL